MRLTLALAIIFLTLLLLFVSNRVGAEENKTRPFIRDSYLDPQKAVVFDDYKPKGYLRRSYLAPNNRYVQFDKDGKAKGYYRQDYINPNRTIWIDKKEIKDND